MGHMISKADGDGRGQNFVYANEAFLDLRGCGHPNAAKDEVRAWALDPP